MTSTPTSPASLSAALIVIAGLVASGATAQEDPAAVARTLFVDEHNCGLCHAVASADIARKSDKVAGVDLGGYATDDVESLASYLRKDEERDGEAHKKTYRGTDEELEAMLTWLATLEAAPE